MHSQATITIACKSGQVYQTKASRGDHLPFLVLCTGATVAGVDKSDEPEVRLGNCIAEFALIAERLFFYINASETHATRAPVSINPLEKEDEIEEFANFIVYSFIAWAGYIDTSIKERADLAEVGYVAEAEIEALAARYKAHVTNWFSITGKNEIEINTITTPERALRLYSHLSSSNYMINATKKYLGDYFETYLTLRYQGVTQERLILAMANEAQYFMTHGYVKKYQADLHSD